ncbi:hypothetical protein AS9A_2397 [Hoyosella subflava DQS3-9A1]|uniref:Uncharacterized protein n=1 Tax=Hoyosella subflava (strain DSM 45089 / JCM 17490 / NBRC 109087 / DQS3-9A1) TaxID=443218 RepID=F6EEP4_HOYSD|nr:hypothetical protein AS9A_2397 [Hoyosella subflava DQS3-9A1]
MEGDERGSGSGLRLRALGGRGVLIMATPQGGRHPRTGNVQRR